MSDLTDYLGGMIGREYEKNRARTGIGLRRYEEYIRVIELAKVLSKVLLLKSDACDEWCRTRLDGEGPCNCLPGCIGVIQRDANAIVKTCKLINVYMDETT